MERACLATGSGVPSVGVVQCYRLELQQLRKRFLVPSSFLLLLVMASNLIATASTPVAMASKLTAIMKICHPDLGMSSVPNIFLRTAISAIPSPDEDRLRIGDFGISKACDFELGRSVFCRFESFRSFCFLFLFLFLSFVLSFI